MAIKKSIDQEKDKNEGYILAEEDTYLYDDDDDDDDDDESYYYDDYDDDDDDDTFNSTNYLSQKYTSRPHPICIRLNDRESPYNRLETSENILNRKYRRQIQRLGNKNLLLQILDEVFPEGLQKCVYIRNLSFNRQDGYEVRVLGIRPTVIEGDFLSWLLPPKHSLLFKGHISGREFIVDAILETADVDFAYDFEVECLIIPYSGPSRINANFLYNIQDKAGSLTRFTEEHLNEWKNYLDWKEKLAEKQINGCKYFRITADEKKNRLVFWLISKSKEDFSPFRRYLNREIEAFSNDYSEDEWVFTPVHAVQKGRPRYEHTELGRYRGILKEYYLFGEESSSDGQPAGNTSTKTPILQPEDTDVPNEFCERYGDNPYIVQASFDLNRDDTDRTQDLQGEDLLAYILETAIPSYEDVGFLALSAVGEFVLIDRFRKAITQLENGECYSPNLAAWLFNIESCYCPDDDEMVTVDSWLNPGIASNEEQKQAVIKMLSAIDLCLIQGPPGTGKTTVIAEAIYQFVRRGQRVLVASQSNDAVDNALERLPDTPEVRAIRLGQKRRRQNSDDKANRFSEETVLQNYYKTLSIKLSETWLGKWDLLETQRMEYKTDIRNAKYFQEDIVDLNSQLRKIIDNENAFQEALAKTRNTLRQAYAANTQIYNENRQFVLFKNFVYQNSMEPFFLSREQLHAVLPAINQFIAAASDKGIRVAQSKLDEELFGNEHVNQSILLIKQYCRLLTDLADRATSSLLNQAGDDPELIRLELKQNELDAALLKALDAGDDAQISDLREARRNVKFQIEIRKQNGSSALRINETERSLLSPEFEDALTGDNRAEAIKTLRHIVGLYQPALEQAAKDLAGFMDVRKHLDTSALEEEDKAFEGRLRSSYEEHRKLQQNLENKRNTLQMLRDKYKLDTNDAQRLITYIQHLLANTERALAEQKSFRSQWEHTLREFKSRLEKKDAYPDDSKRYLQTYINSCNVVGISCTDDMRNLDRTFNDFDVVIIDEVSKATPPELLIPLMKARTAILVGDHRQLPPMFKEHEKSYQEIVQQIEQADENQVEGQPELRTLLTRKNYKRFRDMVTSSLFKEYFENSNDCMRHSLLVQYRMHPDIMNVINRFYDNRLQCGLTPQEADDKKNHGLNIKALDGTTLISTLNHAYWLDSSKFPSGKPAYESYIARSTSACNFLEVHMILELLKKMADAHRETWQHKKKQKTVGVISFYQMQVNELRRTLREARRKFDFSPLDIDINTVDRFQGKEKNIIITSLVRNNKGARASGHIVAFERINVAFSRAQELLVIVGARNMYAPLMIKLPNMDKPGYKTVPAYKNIIEELNRKGCLKGSGKLITQELEDLIAKKQEESSDEK